VRCDRGVLENAKPNISIYVAGHIVHKNDIRDSNEGPVDDRNGGVIDHDCSQEIEGDDGPN